MKILNYLDAAPTKIPKKIRKLEKILISTIEGIILHVTDSELNLFPEKPDESKDANSKEDCTNVKENRKVDLNNNWQVKDSIRSSPAFQGIIEEDPNDWLADFYFREY